MQLAIKYSTFRIRITREAYGSVMSDPSTLVKKLMEELHALKLNKKSTNKQLILFWFGLTLGSFKFNFMIWV